ncbi:MAG: TonB-dependent receptor domain-containing protein [Ilyomonas sp.]
MKRLIAIILCSLTAFISSAQNAVTVTGRIINKTSQAGIPAVSVTIKGTNIGTYTDEKGDFKLTTNEKQLPFTLVISSIGYTQQEVQVNSTKETVNVELEASYVLGQEIVVAASRLPERILESPVSIERVNAANIRNAPGASYYDALGHLKGVDVTTSSYTFKTVSTRGFNGSGNLRFNQLVDGMDNAAPALNFSVGNVIGLTELDVDNMELLSGASSALYGSGGMNGTLLINSKDPFKYQGVSFQVKQGIMHISDPRHKASPFYDWSLRWGKKVSEKFAFKIGAQYIKAQDWEADDSTNLLRNNVFSSIKSGSRISDPNYDGVNIYGDEASASMSALAQAASAQIPAQAIPLLNGLIDAGYSYQQIQQTLQGTAPALLPALPFYMALRTGKYQNTSANISRTGYAEKSLVDYNSYNIKFSGGLYYNINSNIEASLTGNWGLGTSVYTGADRYSLKNFVIGQYKLEFKSPNWFIRAYTTQENSGDSYATTLTALAINNAWKSNSDWFAQYVGNYSGAVLSGMPDAQAHAYARSIADQGRYLPGTPEFDAAFNTSVKTPISKGGSQFADKSDLYEVEGQWNLSNYIKVLEVLVGADYRMYHLNSNGTIFADIDGPIDISEYGAYIQLQKSFLKDVLKLTASGRYDKNENFKGRFTPRITGLIKVAKYHNIRLSYQQAYRFPNNQDQYINLQSPASFLIGGLPLFKELYHFDTNPVYTVQSVLEYRATVAAGTPNPTVLKVAPFIPPTPESMESFELGYRGVIAEKLLLDAYIYTSKYKNFIGRVAVARGISGDPSKAPLDLASPFTTTNFSFVTTTDADVKANGWGISADYLVGKGYRLLANVYSDVLNHAPEGFVTFFNTPKYRYNLGFSNSNVYKGLGFNILYKWQDKVFWEGTFGTGEIPSFGTVDMQVSYKIGKTNHLIKLGANNLFNNYYRNAFGNPYVGGLYYISFGYNVF